MTSICSSGSSQPIPGLASDLIATGPYLAGALATIYPWIGVVAAGLTLANIHLPTFCAVDPPADPGMTAADYLELLAFVNDPTASSAYGKLTQAALRALWPYLCQCTSGGTYTPLPPVTAPTGLPAYNPPGVVPVLAAPPCFSYSHGSYGTLSAGTGFSTPGWTTGPGLTDNSRFANVTSVVSTMTTTPVSGTLGSVKMTGTWYTTSFGSPDLVDSYTVPAGGGTVSHTFVRPGISPNLDLAFTVNPSATGTVTVNGTTQQDYCDNAAPGAAAQPCCPPDPTQSLMLQQILQMVTLVQRQAVPFAYVAGTAHAGLTGTGTVAVSGILALAAQVTTLPTQLGREAGTPLKLFDVGWLNLGTLDGYEEPVYLRAQNQLVVPRSAGLVTTVGYSLNSGVVMTLQELVRES